MTASLEDSSEVEGLLKRSGSLIEAGDYRAAGELLESYLSKHPSNREVLRELARILIHRGRRDRAICLLDKVSELTNDGERDHIPHARFSTHASQSTRMRASGEVEFTELDLEYVLDEERRREAKRLYFDYSNPEKNYKKYTSKSEQTETNQLPKNAELLSGEGISNESCSALDTDSTQAVGADTPVNIMVPPGAYRGSVGAEPIASASHWGGVKPEQTGSVFAQTMDEKLTDEIDREISEIFVADDDEIEDPEEGYEHINAGISVLSGLQMEYEDPLSRDVADWSLLDEYLGDYEEETVRQDLNADVKTDGFITREDRAKQIAIEVGKRYGLNHDGINLLSEIFGRHLWSRAKLAIETLLSSGVSMDDLRLAYQVRIVWAEHEEFSENLIGYPYPALPWSMALLLASAYSSVPAIEEVEMALNEIYLDWYASRSTVRVYPSFKQYLEARIQFPARQNLVSPAVWLGQCYLPEDDEYLSGVYSGFNTPLRKDLESYGLIPDFDNGSIGERVGIIEINKEAKASLTPKDKSNGTEAVDEVSCGDHGDEKSDDKEDVTNTAGWKGNRWYGKTIS